MSQGRLVPTSAPIASRGAARLTPRCNLKRGARMTPPLLPVAERWPEQRRVRDPVPARLLPGGP